jgi:hypothetical protein
MAVNTGASQFRADNGIRSVCCFFLLISCRAVKTFGGRNGHVGTTRRAVRHAWLPNSSKSSSSCSCSSNDSNSSKSWAVRVTSRRSIGEQQHVQKKRPTIQMSEPRSRRNATDHRKLAECAPMAGGARGQDTRVKIISAAAVAQHINVSPCSSNGKARNVLGHTGRPGRLDVSAHSTISATTDDYHWLGNFVFTTFDYTAEVSTYQFATQHETCQRKSPRPTTSTWINWSKSTHRGQARIARPWNNFEYQRR